MVRGGRLHRSLLRDQAIRRNWRKGFEPTISTFPPWIDCKDFSHQDVVSFCTGYLFGGFQDFRSRLWSIGKENASASDGGVRLLQLSCAKEKCGWAPVDDLTQVPLQFVIWHILMLKGHWWSRETAVIWWYCKYISWISDIFHDLMVIMSLFLEIYVNSRAVFQHIWLFKLQTSTEHRKTAGFHWSWGASKTSRCKKTEVSCFQKDGYSKIDDL